MSSTYEDALGRLLLEIEALEAASATSGPLRDSTTPTEPETVVRIASTDVDGSGSITVGRCADLLRNVREQHQQEFYGIDAAAYTRRWGAAWAQTRYAAVHVHPVRGFEEVHVRTRVVACDDTTVEIESWVLDRSRRVLKVLARSCYEHREVATGMPARPREEVLRLLRRVRVSAEPPDLAARADAIAAELKR